MSSELITIKFTFPCGGIRYLKLSGEHKQRMDTGKKDFVIS